MPPTKQLLRRYGPASVVFGHGHRLDLDLRNGGRYTGSMLEFAAQYDALRCRDPAWDGVVFVGVKTTGVYCRPVCPARTPLPRNVAFYQSAAAAERAGFRPCLRCRPETAPFCPAWKGTKTTVERALVLIEGGALDRVSVDQLANRLGSGRATCRACLSSISMLHRCKLRSRSAYNVPSASSRKVNFQSLSLQNGQAFRARDA